MKCFTGCGRQITHGGFFCDECRAATKAAPANAPQYSIPAACQEPPRADPSDPVPVRFSEVKPADPRAEGVARAVANLSSHEYRLGSSRFQP